MIHKNDDKHAYCIWITTSSITMRIQESITADEVSRINGSKTIISIKNYVNTAVYILNIYDNTNSVRQITFSKNYTIDKMS